MKENVFVDEDPAVIRERAQALARETRKMMRDLRKIRSKHMSQDVAASRMDMTQAGVSQLERHDANPTLVTIQRYALAVGARLFITVVDENEYHVEEVDTLPNVEITSPRRAQLDWAKVSVTLDMNQRESVVNA